MNTRAIGRKLENIVSAYLESIDKKSRPTIGSGSKTEIGDILNKNFYVECKYRNTKDVTLKQDVWDKLCSEVPLSSTKIPIYVLKNNTNQIFVVSDIKDFINIIEKAFKEKSV
jgi:hypothetical protein